MQLTEGDDVIITDASQPNKLKVGVVTFAGDVMLLSHYGRRME